MAASTSTAVPFAPKENGLLLLAVVIRATLEVKDYTTQFEDQCNFVDDMGTNVNDLENTSVLDVLAMRERRLDAALVKESNTIATLAKFCVAENNVLYAQSVATAAALAPLSGVVATSTTTPPATTLGASGKKIMKRKLPEPNDG